MKLYIIGTFKNDRIEPLGDKLRKHGFEVFDSWRATHPESDQIMWKYERARGHNYKEALRGLAAQNAFLFDKRHLDNSDLAILVMDAGRSAHIEAGYMIGCGKPVFVLLEPEKKIERLDLMHNFLTDFFETEEELIKAIEAYKILLKLWRTGDAEAIQTFDTRRARKNTS